MEVDLGDLPDLLDDEDIEAVASVSSLVADDGARRLTLGLRVRGGNELDVERVVVCDGVVRWGAGDGVILHARVTDDHPALRALTEDRATLYFTDAPPDPARAADAVHGVLARVLGPHAAAAVALNRLAGGVEPLLRAGSGKLADGPVGVLEELTAALAREGTRPSVLASGPPVVHDDDAGGWVAPPPGLGVLDLGAAWVVARRVRVEPGT